MRTPSRSGVTLCAPDTRRVCNPSASCARECAGSPMRPPPPGGDSTPIQMLKQNEKHLNSYNSRRCGRHRRVGGRRTGSCLVDLCSMPQVRTRGFHGECVVAGALARQCHTGSAHVPAKAPISDARCLGGARVNVQSMNRPTCRWLGRRPAPLAGAFSSKWSKLAVSALTAFLNSGVPDSSVFMSSKMRWMRLQRARAAGARA